MSDENHGWFQPERLEAYAAREAEVAARRRRASMTKPEGEARMDCRDAVGLVERLRSWGYAPGRATALEAADMIEALSAPVPTGEGGAVAWRARYAVGKSVDTWSLHETEPKWLTSDGSGDYEVQPLYAHPKPAQGEGVEALREKVHAIIEPLVLGLATEFSYAERRAFANKKTDEIMAALPPAEVKAETGEGEAVAWGCFQNGQLDERLVYRDERRAGDAAFAFTPSLDVRPLYANPKPTQGGGGGGAAGEGGADYRPGCVSL